MSDPAVQRAQNTFMLWVKILDLFRNPLKIVSFWVPIIAVRGVVSEFAGKNTDVRLQATVSATLAVTLAGGGWVALMKMKAQREEIQRLRAVIEGYERSQALPPPTGGTGPSNSHERRNDGRQ